MPQPILKTNEISGECPVHLINSTIVPCPGTNLVFLYGGFDYYDHLDSNVYLLNTTTMAWDVNRSHPGLYRDGHLAVYIGNGNILVFGGVPYEELTTHRRLPDISNDALMMIYSLFDRKWISPPSFALDNAPSGRSRHACCVSPDGAKVYISGGLVNSSTLGDLYAYDLRSGSWEGPYNFVERFDHSITIFNDRIFSFGGLNKDMNHVTDTLAYFDLKDHTVGEIKLLSSPQNKLYGASLGHSNFERLYLDLPLPFVKLNVCLPSMNDDLTIDPGFYVSYYDLDRLKCVSLVDVRTLTEPLFGQNSNLHIREDDWKHVVVSEAQTLMFLGTAPDADSDEDARYRDPKLNYVLEIQLDNLGLPHDRDTSSTQKTLSSDYWNLFVEGNFTDFEIVCFKAVQTRDTYNTSLEEFKGLERALETPVKNHDLLETVHVHRTVLLARWPHFKRLIESGMTESVNNRMFIPEPSLWVKAMLFYLYTGTIEQVTAQMDSSFNIVDFSGLLIMSNFYELLDLRSRIIGIIHERLNLLTRSEDMELEAESTITSLLKLWSNLVAANEQILIDQVTDVLRLNWHDVLASESFSNLNKDILVHLCQACTSPPNGSPRRLPRKRRSRLELVFGSHDSLSTLDSLRSTHSKSPFIQAGSRPYENVAHEEFNSKLPALQHPSIFQGNKLNEK